MKSHVAARNAALLTLAVASTTHAAPTISECPATGLCYSLNIPESTASSGNGDIFFQISASTSYQWVALGQGTSMPGSNIFVLYSSSDGQNVTLSPRLGTGFVMPQYNSAASVTLLEGSGIDNGMMIANVKCSNCNSWSGGSMDLTSSGSSNWIYAYKAGSPLNSDSTSQNINKHDNAQPFTWNLAGAQGGSDLNPFVSSPSPSTASSAAASTATSTAASTAPSGAVSTGSSTATSGSSTSATSASASSTPTCASNQRFVNGVCQYQPEGPSFGPPGAVSDGAPFGGDAALGNRIAVIHGSLASVAFVALFPIGGILIRIANFTGLIWVHAVLQMVAYAIYFVAFGMGAYLMANLQGAVTDHAHPAIGGILFVVLLSQPITGFIHHRKFKRTQTRTAWSHIHLTIGRAAILIGMINGGLGIALAGNLGNAVSTGGIAAYAVFAVIMAIAYVTSIVIGERRRKRMAEVRRGEGVRLQDIDTGDAVPVAQQFPKQLLA